MHDPHITALFQAARQGDGEAFDVLYTKVYDELKKLARVVRVGRASDTLNTTALVHEAYERLVPSDEICFENRVHFFRLAAKAMRFILTDSARRRTAVKRGGNEKDATFEEEAHVVLLRAEELLTLDEALQKLESIDERKAQVVECRYFAGLTIEDTALTLSISIPTVQRDWRAARAWLASEMSNVQ